MRASEIIALNKTTQAITGRKGVVSVFSLTEPDTGHLKTAKRAVYQRDNLKYDAIRVGGNWYLTGNYEYA